MQLSLSRPPRFPEGPVVSRASSWEERQKPFHLFVFRAMGAAEERVGTKGKGGNLARLNHSPLLCSQANDNSSRLT